VLQLTSSDVAFIEQRKLQVGDICRFYRVPPFKLGATELRGIDIEEINNDYVSGTVMPDLQRVEQKIEQVFDLKRQNISVQFDERVLLRSATGRCRAARDGQPPCAGAGHPAAQRS
jgi:phage portal protein BeeE